MEKRQYQIVLELMNTRYLTGNELALKLKMSSRSIRTMIKDINCEIEQHGAFVESSKAYGYSLEIRDMDAFLILMQEESLHREDINDPQERLLFLFQKFIQSDQYFKLDDLCEELCLSRTQLKQSIKILRAYFETYDLHLEAKPHAGIRLEGSELKKRLCIAHFDMNRCEGSFFHHLEDEQGAVEKISNIVSSCIQNADYLICDDAFHNLVIHLFIAMKRIQKQQYVPMELEMLEKLKQEQEFNIASAIMTLMSQLFHIDYEESECGYITIHLLGKKLKSSNAMLISEDITVLVQKVLTHIKETDQIQFLNDFHLQLALSSHLAVLAKRIEYQMYMKNPLLEDIKSSIFHSYEIAIHAAEVINEEYRCSLPEDEIGYFALHFNLAMERNLNEITKLNILIVCSSGAGSAQLLKFKFLEQFSPYISRLEVCSALDLKRQGAKGFDYVFTTIPIELDEPVPVVAIHHFLNEQDITLIKQNLLQTQQSTVAAYFDERLFFNEEKMNSKEEAIHFLVERCKRYYQLPADYEQQILEREKIASTEFQNYVAFPHASQLFSDRTFVAVLVLKKPLVWKVNKVRIILLASIEKGTNKQLNSFYKVVSRLIRNEQVQGKLMEKPSYDTLKELIQEIEGL